MKKGDTQQMKNEESKEVWKKIADNWRNTKITIAKSSGKKKSYRK